MRNQGNRGNRWMAFLLAGAVLLGSLGVPTLAVELEGRADMTGEIQEQVSGSDTCYEVFVYSFFDSDGDGIGDLEGIREKLSYIGEGEDGLGCDMLWLTPIFPSPTYHKYDVTDYQAVDEAFGSLEDFDALARDCQERGIRLIIDLPVNHTSWEHPWFLKAKEYLESLPSGQAPSLQECPEFGFYHFSQQAQSGYAPLGETGWYYEAQFWEGMPDLDLDSEAVRREIENITGFWASHGVDGFRLDAVTYFYSGEKERTNSFLSWLNQTVKDQNPQAYLVGEAWTDAESYAAFYESGIDSFFDFAFSGSEGVITAVARGNRGADWYGQKLMQEEALFASHRESYVNAPFYTNHDLARSAGYYTRDDGSRHKLAEGLNLLMPGVAFLYYGEELGMKGSGRDENKRLGMYWSDDPEARGLCQGPPEREEVSQKYPSLEDQMKDGESIFRYVQKAIQIRRAFPAIAGGTTTLVEELSGKAACVLLRERKGFPAMLLCINTSEQAQEIDFSESGWEGLILQEELLARGGEATLEGDVLHLPPFGIAVLSWQEGFPG